MASIFPSRSSNVPPGIGSPVTGRMSTFTIASGFVFGGSSETGTRSSSPFLDFFAFFARIGLIPDAGGSWSLPRLVGPARSRGLAMLAEPIGAETAEEWGLIWKAINDDSLMAEAQEMAMKLANGPTLGLALTKQAMLAAATNSLEEQLLLEEQLQARAGASDDYREGVSAFLEKRPAKFSGR